MGEATEGGSQKKPKSVSLTWKDPRRVCLYVCNYACMYVGMYVCMYVLMNVMYVMYVMQCNVMQCNVMWCNVMWRGVI